MTRLLVRSLGWLHAFLAELGPGTAFDEAGLIQGGGHQQGPGSARLAKANGRANLDEHRGVSRAQSGSARLSRPAHVGENVYDSNGLQPDDGAGRLCHDRHDSL